MEPDEPTFPLRDICVANFDVNIIARTRGENVIYLNLLNKGLVSLTGCCHAGILELLSYAKKNINGGNKFYGIYSGLHIAPFEDWSEEKDTLVQQIKKHEIKYLGSNHCTGKIAVQKMIDAGIPVIKGSGRKGSQNDLFLGNGDIFHLL